MTGLQDFQDRQAQVHLIYLVNPANPVILSKMNVSYMRTTPPLILASQSPRRAELLREARIDFEQRSPPFADPDQPPAHLRGDEAEAYAASLAAQKARSLAAVLTGSAVILAADTICVDDHGELVGKPRDRAHAWEMLRSFIETEHRVLTGVSLLRVGSDEQAIESFADVAVVRFGSVGEFELDAYLDTDDWQGKAGGYNLFDRQAAGWPIEVEGDPTTVVGLPMRRLVPMLKSSLHSSP
ncbi:MAG: nucleoside triphosphate pyrophosphatase [Phycisphaeraceae bacterium]